MNKIATTLLLLLFAGQAQSQNCECRGPMSVTLRSLEPLQWVVSDRVLIPGDTMQVGFSVYNFDSIAAYQYALRYDSAKMELIGVSIPPVPAIPMSDLGATFFADAGDTIFFPGCIVGDFGLCTKGEIRTVWTNPWSSTAPGGSLIYTLHFMVKQADTLSNILALAPDVLQAWAWDYHLDKTPSELYFTELPNNAITHVSAAPEHTPQVYGYPNPFTDAFSLSVSGWLSLYDIHGRRVYCAAYNAGERVRGDFAPGAYFGIIGNNTFKIIKQ